MPTDNVDKAVAWDAAQASWQKGYARAKAESADTIESLRAEVSRLSAELEGARKETIERMALVALDDAAVSDDLKRAAEKHGDDHAVRIHSNDAFAARRIAAAIRQKGETP